MLKILFVVPVLGELPKPGFDVLGWSYDAFLGNPLTTGSGSVGDPGFRAPIFNFSYSEGERSPDGKWPIPDKTTASMHSTCQETLTQRTYNSVYCFRDALEIAVNLNVGFVGNQASFSSDYRKIQTRTEISRSMFAQTTIVCSRYKLLLHMYDLPELGTNFKNGVRSLPPLYNEDTKGEYMQFLSVFGTHFPDQIYLGGRWGLQMEFKRDSWQSLLDSNINIKLGIEGMAKLRAGISTDIDKKTIQTVENATADIQFLSVGGDFDKDSTVWMKSIEDKPMPVQMEMSPLSMLFDAKYLPGIDDLALRKSSYLQAIADYCSWKAKYDPTIQCTPPLPIPQPQPDPVLPTAVRRICVQNRAGFVMYFALTTLNRINPVTATSGRYPNPQDQCIEGSQVDALRGDELSCEVTAIAGKTQNCEVNRNQFDARSNLQANYQCTGATLTYACRFIGLTKINPKAQDEVDLECPS